jgi:hypothetical protein
LCLSLLSHPKLISKISETMALASFSFGGAKAPLPSFISLALKDWCHRTNIWADTSVLPLQRKFYNMDYWVKM